MRGEPIRLGPERNRYLRLEMEGLASQAANLIPILTSKRVSSVCWEFQPKREAEPFEYLESR